MERLFSPCTPELLLELNLDVSPEEILNAERAFTYANLHAMFGIRNIVAWLTPHAAVVRGVESVVHASNCLDGLCGFCFKADGKDIVVVARSAEYLLEICNVVLRLLAVSKVHSVILQDGKSAELFISAPTLACMMEQCQSLKVLTLKDLKMDEDHCRVLGDYSRPGLEIVLNDVESQVLERVLWQRSLDAIRDRPSFIYVRLTILFSRMGCAETVV
jgi:hypothetical protein